MYIFVIVKELVGTRNGSYHFCGINKYFYSLILILFLLFYFLYGNAKQP